MLIKWNLYNETGKVLLKTHKFHHLPGTAFKKSCLFSLSWETTCLERPQNLVIALYRFRCIQCSYRCSGDNSPHASQANVFLQEQKENIKKKNKLKSYECQCNLAQRTWMQQVWIYNYLTWKVVGPGGRFKNTYELLNLRALKISKLHKNHIFQCMGKIFCVEFQRVPLKFHTKYLTHTLKDVDFIHIWKFKSSLI